MAQPTNVRTNADAPANSNSEVYRVQVVDDAGDIVADFSGGAAAGLTDAELRASAVPVSLTTDTDAIGRVGHDTTGLGDGQQEVASAGTAEALAGSTPAKWVVVSAQPGNTNPVAVGAATVLATAGAERGAILSAGDSVTLLIDNLAEVFVDAVTNGEGVSFVYGT